MTKEPPGFPSGSPGIHLFGYGVSQKCLPFLSVSPLQLNAGRVSTVQSPLTCTWQASRASSSWPMTAIIVLGSSVRANLLAHRHRAEVFHALLDEHQASAAQAQTVAVEVAAHRPAGGIQRQEVDLNAGLASLVAQDRRPAGTSISCFSLTNVTLGMEDDSCRDDHKENDLPAAGKVAEIVARRWCGPPSPRYSGARGHPQILPSPRYSGERGRG